MPAIQSRSFQARYLFALTVIGAALCMMFATPPAAHAAVSNWFAGGSLQPTWNGDFGSASAQQSIKNLHDNGANYVVLIIPIYQSNVGSTDVAPGWNTPTDASLASAIDYAHSLGMHAALKIHLESYDGQWRAHINPGDRTTWFKNYQAQLLHFAGIAQSHHAEMMVLGTELVDMASSFINGSNTQNWVNMIAAVRGAYTGALTYSANSNNNNTGDYYSDEKAGIGFWSSLDYAGLSAYYTLNSDNSVGGLSGAWDYWNNNDIKPFQAQVHKPVIFTEVGYRSVSGAHYNPWDYNLGGGYDPTEQSNDYQALFSYWNNYSYMQGVFLWEWRTDPNAGGSGDTGYTPQNKPAQSILKQWLTNPTTPTTPPSQPSFNSTVSPNPTGTNAGGTVTLTTNVTNGDGAISNVLVDVEVYDQNGSRVYQQSFPNQNFTAGGSNQYNPAWSPSAAGTYTVKVGVFSNNWSTLYNWNNSAAQVVVGAGSGASTGGTGGGGSTGGGGTSSGTATTQIWWPTNGTTLSGTQPLKAIVQGMDVSQYHMYWQVDTGGKVEMYNSNTDYPHKESLVDFTGWNWKGKGPYTLTFTSTDNSGKQISQASINIYTQ